MRSVSDRLNETPGSKLRPAAVVALLGAIILLSGCGGDKQPAPTTQAPVAIAEAAASHAHADVILVADRAVHADHAQATDHVEHTDPVHVHDEAHTLPAQPLAALSGDSVYHLKSAWTDHHSMPVTLPDLAGGPAVVVMFYGDCTTACPLLVKSAEEIEAALPEHLRAITSFVMVSFDTERDTPGRLLDYAASKGLDRDGWHWLVGTPLQTRQLATMLGVQYRDAGNGVWAHSNVVSVLDAGGVPVARLEGLGVELVPAVEAIKAAAGG